MSRILFTTALAGLGLPKDFKLDVPGNFELAMKAWKDRAVEARRDGNEEREKTLSLCKAVVQKRQKALASKKCECGRAKSAVSEHCQICALRVRAYGNQINIQSTRELHTMNSTIPIPRRHYKSELRDMLVVMASGHTGDSFITNRKIRRVYTVAKVLGGVGKYRTRRIVDSTGNKNTLLQVWRSDGLSLSEVNAIIKKRMENPDSVPKPPPWVPLEGEELMKFQAKLRCRNKTAGDKAPAV